jgi:hypothetical protein
VPVLVSPSDRDLNGPSPAAVTPRAVTPAGVRPTQLGWVPNRRRILWPLLLSALIVLGTWTPPSPLRDAATRAPVADARLVYSDLYIIFAPLFDLLDTLTILTVPQHWAILGSTIIAFVAVRAWRLAVRRVRFAWWKELLWLVATLAGLVGLYALAALAPRPMAKLQVADPEVLVLDVHAHTEHSHDGRPGWTAEDVRRWHADAGYHVAYITEHTTYRTVAEAFRGQQAGMAANPARAGDGVVLLGGLEVRSGGQNVNVLSMMPADSVHFLGGNHIGGGWTLARDGRPPVVVQTVPFDLARIAGPSDDSLLTATALEINAGAPRGLAQNLRDHEALLRIADSLDLALVAGSDNHGWGRTAVGWTLLRLPGWRDLAPAELAQRIEDAIRDGRSRATRVIERRTPELEIGPQLLLIVPLMLYELNAGLSPSQRLSWICWIWGFFHFGPLFAAWRRGRRILRNANGSVPA